MPQPTFNGRSVVSGLVTYLKQLRGILKARDPFEDLNEPLNECCNQALTLSFQLWYVSHWQSERNQYKNSQVIHNENHVGVGDNL